MLSESLGITWNVMRYVDDAYVSSRCVVVLIVVLVLIAVKIL